MNRKNIRNVAIIAHVDHGKTTLVDQLLRQCGQFRPSELVGDCILDSNPLERERGITIFSKNCAIEYTNRAGERFHINIIDTPGHADFGGEVQRVLKMADGVLLLVDAAEGPMPQTRYVLSRALENGLRPIIVINKMDRPDARAQETLDEVFGLLIDLGADETLLDCPVIFAAGRDGWASPDINYTPVPGQGDIHAVFDAIIEHVPVPDLDPAAPLQMLVTTIDYNDYVGRIAIGRVFAGTLEVGRTVTVIDRHGGERSERIVKLLQFDGLGRKEVERIDVGDICAVVGLERVDIGDTLADPDHPQALPPLSVDEPTLHMTFHFNDSPFAGREGKYVTSRQLRERLDRELQSNVALRVAYDERTDEFDVAGRGLLHLGILLENMRREGFEVAVGKPQAIFKELGGQRHEPIELLVVEVPKASVGAVMQLVGERRANLLRMDNRGAFTYLEFRIPSRGLIGLRNKMLTATAGEAVMHHVFERYEPYRGEIPGRALGVLVAHETGRVTAYALDRLADRGTMFVEPGDLIYEGQIVGEHCKDNDIRVNAAMQKRLTNVRSSTKDATVTLKAPRRLTLEGALEYVEEDELVELTPESIRLRKRLLREIDRRRQDRKARAAASAR